MEEDTAVTLPQDQVLIMIEACRMGNMHTIHQLISQDALYACQQDLSTGQSPLMAAASVGNHALCAYLLEQGAPWNAVDRQGQCAGNYATQSEHWSVVQLLVDWGVRAELVLGALQRSGRKDTTEATSVPQGSSSAMDGVNDSLPAEFQPSTKPDYLRQRLQYTESALLDADKDAVMMEWERPLMQAHAQILMENGKRVLNVGFGMGIIDTALQNLEPSLHIIIEAHPDVYQRMLTEKWNEKPNVRVCFGKWQDVLPQLIEEGVEVDGIFYDTYGEHYLDLEDFHLQMVHLLAKPNGIYSFFNGLAPDNLFFQGVACQCVKLQLGQLGLDADFLACEVQVSDDEWKGVRRPYWHGRDTYYLPKCTWNPDFLLTGTVAPADDEQVEQEGTRKTKPLACDGTAKRPRVDR